MPRRRKNRRDYEVGYARPPKEHQFKPGRSGNPRGRPKGSISVSKLIEKWGERRVSIVLDGQELKMPALEAMVVHMINRGLKGDPKTVSEIFRWLEQIEARRGATPEGTDLSTAREMLKARLDNLARRRTED